MNSDVPTFGNKRVRGEFRGLKVDRIGASQHILRIEIPTEGNFQTYIRGARSFLYHFEKIQFDMLFLDFEFLLQMIGHFSYPVGSPNGILLVNKGILEIV